MKSQEEEEEEEEKEEEGEGGRDKGISNITLFVPFFIFSPPPLGKDADKKKEE